MGKLGKKARKFAKKHLQSVLRTRRKTKAFLFKKKARKDVPSGSNELTDKQLGISNGRSIESEDIENISLDAVFVENVTDELEDASDSDGYLSEDPSCRYVIETETPETPEDETASSTFSDQNEKLHADLAIQKKKLVRLRNKDPEFSEFLESFNNNAETFQSDDEYSDGDPSDQEEQIEENLSKDKGELLTNRVINTWCQMVKEDYNQSAFIKLLNAYRTACHYGTDSIGHRVENCETFCNILLFTLSNADDVFRGLLEIPSSKSTKEAFQELKKTSKWKNLKPLVKSFVRSTLYLLNQVTNSVILAFAITRLRASLVFLVAFPSLIDRLIKAAVHLWATGGRLLSFHVVRDIAAMFNSNHFDICLSRTFAAFISVSRVTEITDIKQMHLLRDCVVELSSLDVQKSSVKAVASINQLSKILSWGLQTKKKEAGRKICSWEYVNCIDVWVRFISANILDYDLQSLCFMTTQLINGLAHMFPGPRYCPLRLKCVQWLNALASSSGNFIPLASLVLDILEYKVIKDGNTDGKNARNALNTASLLKLPKHYLKSRSFQDDCFHSALEQLSFHFSQWSHHISFPDLAIVPLIRLRKIHEITTVESLRRILKRFIDQVEHNVDFVQKRRDEVSFSPHDLQSVDSFLQLEKSSPSAPFTQHYKSVLDKAAERNMHKSAKMREH